MEFSELILKRQSDRMYAPQPVAREHIFQCLEAARMAPSACNSQPWKFVVVDDESILKQVSDAAIGLGMNKFTAQVPVLVAVVQEEMNLSAKAGARIKEKDYSMMDLGMAVENFCLQAAEL
jgi:nitroreductase